MKTFPCLVPVVAGLAMFFPATVRAAKVTSDIAPQVKRQVSVDTANRLANRNALEPVSPELPSPFNPADFEKPDPLAPVPNSPSAPKSSTALNPPPAVVAPPGDRETLETLAAQITPSGMFQVGDKKQLIFKNTRFEVGTRFTASYNKEDYELELVAIDRTTFTLRYRGEEITRPIKPVR